MHGTVELENLRNTDFFDDTDAPANAYAFHAMVRAAAPPGIDLGELPALPGAPRQLGLF